MSLLVKALHKARQSQGLEEPLLTDDPNGLVEEAQVNQDAIGDHPIDEPIKDEPDALLSDSCQNHDGSSEFDTRGDYNTAGEYIERLTLEISELAISDSETSDQQEADPDTSETVVSSGHTLDNPDQSLPKDSSHEENDDDGGASSDQHGDETAEQLVASTAIIEEFQNERQLKKKRQVAVFLIVTVLGFGVAVYMFVANDLSGGHVVNPAATVATESIAKESIDSDAAVDLVEPAATAENEDSTNLTEQALSGQIVSSDIATGVVSKASPNVRPEQKTLVSGNAEVQADYNPITISRRRAAPLISQHLSDAYQQFKRGELDAAAKIYEKVLRERPSSASAINGLGAIAVERGDSKLAEQYFYAALERDPANAYAKAALLELHQTLDQREREVMLQNIAQQTPNNAVAAFALGQFYAEEKHWARAQSHFFEAFSADTGNADYAFNLAVSLDHLGKTKSAIEYYSQALHLSDSRPGAFSKEVVKQRLAQLTQMTRVTL